MTILVLVLICIIIYLLYKINEPFDNSLENNSLQNNSLQNNSLQYNENKVKGYNKYTLKYNNEDYVLILYSQLNFLLQAKVCNMILNKEINLDIPYSEIKELKTASELQIPVVPRNDIIFAIKPQKLMNLELNRSRSILIFNELLKPQLYDIDKSYINPLTYNLVELNDTILLNSTIKNINIDIYNNQISNKFIKLKQITDLELYEIILTDVDNNIRLTKDIIKI